MKKDFVLTEENFNNLLNWLSTDREKAGAKYEEVRKHLTTFFRYKGCSEPDELADETINRVAAKVSTFYNNGEVKTITFFYSFAINVHREYLANMKKKHVSLEPNMLFADQPVPETNENKDIIYDCLDRCLAKLGSQESEMLIAYYSPDKSGKSELRKKMADALNLKTGALHTKIHRIRNIVRECIENCLSQKNL
ncbi:MAG TPA: hypothetical protein VF556_12945 [Pyrinomonadaceae bacterium]|jgi:RNA polymerase sigma factor (sigma-70 family)